MGSIPFLFLSSLPFARLRKVSLLFSYFTLSNRLAFCSGSRLSFSLVCGGGMSFIVSDSVSVDYFFVLAIFLICFFSLLMGWRYQRTAHERDWPGCSWV